MRFELPPARSEVWVVGTVHGLNFGLPPATLIEIVGLFIRRGRGSSTVSMGSDRQRNSGPVHTPWQRIADILGGFRQAEES